MYAHGRGALLGRVLGRIGLICFFLFFDSWLFALFFLGMHRYLDRGFDSAGEFDRHFVITETLDGFGQMDLSTVYFVP